MSPKKIAEAYVVIFTVSEVFIYLLYFHNIIKTPVLSIKFDIVNALFA